MAGESKRSRALHSRRQSDASSGTGAGDVLVRLPRTPSLARLHYMQAGIASSAPDTSTSSAVPSLLTTLPPSPTSTTSSLAAATSVDGGLARTARAASFSAFTAESDTDREEEQAAREDTLRLPVAAARDFAASLAPSPNGSLVTTPMAEKPAPELLKTTTERPSLARAMGRSSTDELDRASSTSSSFVSSNGGSARSVHDVPRAEDWAFADAFATFPPPPPSEEELVHMLDGMAQIVFTTDFDGHLVYVNRRWFEFTGMQVALSHELSNWIVRLFISSFVKRLLTCRRAEQVSS